MKRLIVFLILCAVCFGVSWAAFQGVAVEEPAYSHFFPSGALLYLQAKDFSGLLSDWNGSPQVAHARH